MSTDLITECSLGLAPEWIASATDENVLLGKLRECLSLTVENIRNAALIVRRFEMLGLNRDRLEASVPPLILRSLRRIAEMKMLPETFILLNGKVLEYIGNLPIEDQKSLVDGTPVKVAIHSGGHMMVPVDKLLPSQAKQVFSGGRIKSEDEQRQYLHSITKGTPKSLVHAPVFAPIIGTVLTGKDREDEIDEGNDDLPEDFSARLAMVRQEKVLAENPKPLAFHAEQLIQMLNARSEFDKNTLESLTDLNVKLNQILRRSR